MSDAPLRPLRGLYAITSEALCRDPRLFEARLRTALSAGIDWLQYRDKWNPPAQRAAIATRLQAWCREAGTGFIVNDDVVLAAAIGADGVHVGADDAGVAAARSALGATAVVGASCSNSMARAREAAAAGASYLAFGRFFASRTKPDAPPAPLALLGEARAQLALPLCAIGGITPDNAAPLLQRGAALLAVVDAVFGHDDPPAAVAAFRRLLDRPPAENGASGTLRHHPQQTTSNSE